MSILLILALLTGVVMIGKSNTSNITDISVNINQTFQIKLYEPVIYVGVFVGWTPQYDYSNITMLTPSHKQLSNGSWELTYEFRADKVGDTVITFDHIVVNDGMLIVDKELIYNIHVYDDIVYTTSLQ